MATTVELQRESPIESARRVRTLIYALTIFISAFLLFQVQPLITKYILPWFGGGPAVWSTCVMFFQVVLFGGYLYAHLLTRFLPPLGQAIVHIGLLVLAAALLPIAPSEAWKPADGSEPILRIMLILAASVGLPYFVLSATGPLLQSWFARSVPGTSPYRLYALSNIGSLLALLSYPFFFEPRFDLAEQTWLWSGSFALFAVLCAAGAWIARRESSVKQVVVPTDSASGNGAPTLLHRGTWLLLPAWASLMLLAATNHLCQDIATVPFLWVAPLSIYLLSFIIAFDHARWYQRPVFGVFGVVLVMIIAGIAQLMSSSGGTLQNLDLIQQLIIYLSALFTVCMLCHGELVRLRPPTRWLTEFYLMIAAGGALGGVFVSVVAPIVFKSYLEWRIGLVGSYFLAVAVLVVSVAPVIRRQPFFVVPAAIATAAGFSIIWILQTPTETPTYINRNFYGVVYLQPSEEKDPDERQLQLLNGRILHGTEFINPLRRGQPTSYYARSSGAGQAVAYFQKKRGNVRLGTVGLGAGTMAAYARAGDYVRFYEINPLVPTIAETYFHYLPECRGKYDIVMGDGRISLERELKKHEAQKFDVLVLDAFSSDAIPTHLLTREAFAIYLPHLRDDGVIAVHVTNRYLRLAPVVEAVAEHYHLQTTEINTEANPEELRFVSCWVLVSKNKEFIASHPPVREEPWERGRVRLWTDHYSNLFEIMQ